MSSAIPTPPASPAAATSAPTAAAVPAAATAPRRIAPLRRTNAFVNLRTMRAESTPALTMPGAWPREKKPDPIKAAVEATQEQIRLKRKRAEEDAARDEKRRRVEKDAPAPSRAEAHSTASKPANNAHTGATATTHYISTATAAPSAARNPQKLKATLSKVRSMLTTSSVLDADDIPQCPPPPPLKSKKAASTSNAAESSRPASGPASGSRAMHPSALLLREAPMIIDLGPTMAPSSTAQPGRMALTRRPALVMGTGTGTTSAAAAAQPRSTALLREATTLIDIPTIAPPPSGLSRQPAMIFGVDASVQPSVHPALVPGTGLLLGHMQAGVFLPAASGSPPRRKRETPRSPPPPPRKKRRGKRSGHRSRKLDEHQGANVEKKDKDRDGAATA